MTINWHKLNICDASKCFLCRKVCQMPNVLTGNCNIWRIDATGCQYQAGTYCCHSGFSVLYTDQSRNPLFYSTTGSDSIAEIKLAGIWTGGPPLAAPESWFSTVF